MGVRLNESVRTRHWAQNPARDKCSVNVIMSLLLLLELRGGKGSPSALGVTAFRRAREYLREGGELSLSWGRNSLCHVLDNVWSNLTLNFCPGKLADENTGNPHYSWILYLQICLLTKIYLKLSNLYLWHFHGPPWMWTERKKKMSQPDTQVPSSV